MPDEEKFQPPPSHIFIRSMADDLNTLKEGGGQMPEIAGQPISPSLNPSPMSPEPPSSPNVSQINPLESSEPQASPFTPFSEAPGFSSMPQSPTPSAPAEESLLFGQENMPQEQEAMTAPPQRPRKINRKFLIFGGIGLALIGLALLGYFVIWPAINKPKSNGSVPVVHYTCSSDYQCVENPQGAIATLEECQKICIKPVTPPSPSLPANPLLPVVGPYNAQLSNLNLTNSCPLVLNAIKTEAKKLGSTDSFKIIIPKVRTEPLTSEEIALTMIPKLPKQVLEALTTRYLVFAYYGETNPSLGLALEIRPENLEDVKNYFLTWEKKTLTTDLGNFWLTTPKKKPTSLTTYKEKEFLGAKVRYLTYPVPQTVLTYAFFNNYLIITTSNEAMQSAINHLQAGGAQPQI